MRVAREWKGCVGSTKEAQPEVSAKISDISIPWANRSAQLVHQGLPDILVVLLSPVRHVTAKCADELFQGIDRGRVLVFHESSSHDFQFFAGEQRWEF